MNRNSTIYNCRMKMADLVASDISLLSILQRLEISLGFGEATVAEVCAQHNISAELFLMICNIYSFRDYRPQIETLTNDDIRNITTYLRASHKFYSTICFPALHNNIHRMVNELDDVSRRLIDKFYDDYDNEVNSHFRYEEEVVFPYIEQLLGNSKAVNCGFRISLFEHNHGNVNEKLNDLSNIIIKYLNKDYASQLRFEILGDIHNIGNDLLKHSDIENKLLVPLVEKIEQRYE
ncbi:MAG: hemerythrin domain-containing protein [Bacteroidaceae bacterium]|nr:hemerythrin domain-containing protein [Bacteroidaceae bacterium]